MLHNMLRQLSHESYTPDGFIDMETSNGEILQGEWREENIGASVLQSLPFVAHEKQLSVPKK